MTHIDHGSWVLYKPAQARADAPSGAMFCKRENDGVDWYEYVHPGTNFAAGSVKFAARWVEHGSGGYLVGPVVTDANQLFPAGHIVVEISDYAGSDAFADFNGKIYDPATDTFSDVPPPAKTPSLDEIMARLDKLESK
jgi:hypothetical protein